MIYHEMLKPYYLYDAINVTNRDENKQTHATELEAPVNNAIGYLELFVFTERGNIPVRDAIVTIYARQTAVVGVPIQTLITTSNPITIGLPVAHPQGELIRGPEYYFTTYNLTVRKTGYSPVTVLNIRIFPEITEVLDINLFEVRPGTLPIPEQIIDIPPHPRDRV